MLAPGLATFGLALWVTWMALGAGALVISLVLGSTVVYERVRERRRLSAISQEEDLRWDDLLVLIEKRHRERVAAGLPEEEESDEELEEILGMLASLPNARALELPEDREFQLVGGDERRAGRRRWGNPTEVHLRSLLWDGNQHGVVVNRSTGGLGIYTDREVPADTPLQIRAVEAPSYVKSAQAEVRHCVKVGKGFLFGCRFTQSVPWNVRVWFG